MENKEIQIKLSDILASFFKSIISIVLIAVLLGGLLGAYGIYKARQTKADPSVQSTINSLKKDIASKEDSIKHIENSNSTILDVTIPYLERKVDMDRELMESRSVYLNESIYCSIDPFNCGVSRISFTIDVPVPEDAKEEYAQYRSSELSRLVNACTRMYPLSDTSMARVRAIIDVSAEAKYIDELVSITSVNDEMVEIAVFYTEPATAKEVVDYLFEQISAELREISPDCTISVVSTYTGTEVNWEMNTTQLNHQNSILTSDKNLSTDQESISQSYKTYDDNKTRIETINTELKTLKANLAANERKLNVTTSKRDLLKQGIKFGLIGAVIGLVLSCLVVFVKDFLGGKVRSRNSILSRYSYPLLGVMPSSKKYLFDKTVKRLEGDSVYEKKDIVASSSASILAAVAADGGKTCLIGPIDAKDPSFSDLLKSLKGRVEYKGNILAGSEAIKNLEGYDKVILVEKRCDSRYDSIQEEISRIHALHKDVLGFVLL